MGTHKPAHVNGRVGDDVHHARAVRAGQLVSEELNSRVQFQNGAGGSPKEIAWRKGLSGQSDGFTSFIIARRQMNAKEGR